MFSALSAVCHEIASPLEKSLVFQNEALFDLVFKKNGYPCHFINGTVFTYQKLFLDKYKLWSYVKPTKIFKMNCSHWYCCTVLLIFLLPSFFFPSSNL